MQLYVLVPSMSDSIRMVYTKATQQQIGAAISDKLKRYAAVGEAAEALMFAHGEFSASYRYDDDSICEVFHGKEVIGTGGDLAEALKDSTKEGWLE